MEPLQLTYLHILFFHVFVDFEVVNLVLIFQQRQPLGIFEKDHSTHFLERMETLIRVLSLIVFVHLQKQIIMVIKV